MMRSISALMIVAGCASTAPAVELVETTPAEAGLDHADIADAATVWPQLVSSARQTIDLAEFYASDEPRVSARPDGSARQESRLEPVVVAIEAAVRRGVRVRFLTDHSYAKTYPETLARLAASGVTVRLANFDPGVLHAKYFVVDGQLAFFGSQNFDWRALDHNLELGMTVREPGIVDGLAAIFASDWARAAGEPVPATHVPAGSGPITLVASPRALLPPGIAWDLPRLIELIDSATTQIQVQLLTYRAGDWNELEEPLRRAAQRGVHVDLMVADWCKRPKTIGGLQQLARVPGITIRLVTIPPAHSGFIPYARVIHAKVMVVDGTRAWLGTSNWERDYFYDSRNVGVIITDPALATRLGRFFETTWGSRYATPIDPDDTYLPPRIE